MNFKNIFYRLFILISILTIITSACSEKSTTEHSDHTEAIGMILYYNTSPFFKVVKGNIDTNVSKELVFKLNTSYLLEVKFIDEDGEEITPTEEGKSLSWTLDDSNLVDIKVVPTEKWKFSIMGLKIGTTNIQFFLNHYDHPDFRTPLLPLRVIEK
ncbi:MAG: hypothetical protein ACUVQ1_09275 [Candidatus Kapaibacteriales bacterium]